MVSKLIKIGLISLLLFSCERNKVASETQGNQPGESALTAAEQGNADGSTVTEAADNPDGEEEAQPDPDATYILLYSYSFYSEPNIQARQRNDYIWSGTLVKVLQLADRVSVDGKDKRWIELKANSIYSGDYTGWILVDGLSEMGKFTGYFPMNKTDVEYVVLENIGQDARFKLEGESGYFSCEYGMSSIGISYYSRDGEFDRDFQYFNTYDVNVFRAMEYFVNNDISGIPNMNDWSTHKVKRMENGITLVDSFIFTAYEIQSIQIWRKIYFTTDNYDITISMGIDDRTDDSLVRQIITESPQYFVHSDGTPYNGEDIKEHPVQWGTSGRGITVTKFGDDLRGGTHPSRTLNRWYAETEEVLSGLHIE